MQSVPRPTLERFAEVFAYGDSGFALKEITPYFETFQPGIPPPAFDGIAPRKADHFVSVLSAMHPWLNQQTQYDLWHAEQRRKQLRVAKLAV